MFPCAALRVEPGFRAALAVLLAAHLTCVPEIKERCRVVTDPAPPPALPRGFAELDALLLQRATDMTVAARDLNSSLVIVFHRDFAEQLLPVVCERLQQARELAMSGRTAEAGRKYQALLVASQVLAFAVAVQSAAQYADIKGQAGGQITQILEAFANDAAPILEAALTEDPRDIERALNARPEVFTRWAKYLEQWPRRVDAAYRQVEVARVVWDIAFLVAATYEAAGAAAEVFAAGRPLMPPLSVLATGGGAAATGLNGAAMLEMAEALRRLVASGALDAPVVAAISRTLGGRGPPASAPGLPSYAPMSSETGNLPQPEKSPSHGDDMTIRRDVSLSGGRSGERVKDLVGPPKSAVRGGGDRAFFTNDKGQVILDVTRDRVKPVIPGVGFGPKRAPTADELRILGEVLGGER